MDSIGDLTGTRILFGAGCTNFLHQFRCFLDIRNQLAQQLSCLLSHIDDAAYSTTKHAAVGFAESLAITHGDDGIKVSMVCPQAVATRMIGDFEGGGTAGVDGVITPADVAEAVIQGLEEERFLILPHTEVEQYRQNKAANYDRWIGGMRKLRRQFGNPEIK